jgi:hypothetical protein
MRETGNSLFTGPPLAPSLPHHGRMESQLLRPGYLTAHQTATALDISLDGVRQLVRRGHLTSAPGSSPRQRWFALADVQAYAAKRDTPAAA